MERGQVQQVPLHQQLTKISPKQLSDPGPSVLRVRSGALQTVQSLLHYCGMKTAAEWT